MKKEEPYEVHRDHREILCDIPQNRQLIANGWLAALALAMLLASLVLNRSGSLWRSRLWRSG
jgi:hypothetical protein